MKEFIGHYSIVSELGRGGMGVVYKAHEESLNRFVALKVLGKHLSEDESFVQRFKREAQSAAALNHPNIVQVYAIDEFEGQHYFAMEYVQGPSIQQIIKSHGAMDPVAAGRLVLQAAAGLGAAHAHGIVHRDIKPANLMVDERGLVKIADFGLAILAAGTSRLTATGMFMGTPGYLSPEQCLDEEIDGRTDIYSLGVTLYEMLTGIMPVNADSPLALLRQIIDVEPKDVGELRPGIPEGLRIILRKMMAKKPQDRYVDCVALTTDLQSWLETAGEAKSDLNAVIAATVSSTSPGASLGATVISDSVDKIDAGTKTPSQPGARRMHTALIGAVIISLMLGVGYAAWYFNLTEDPEIAIADGVGDEVELVTNDTSAETGSSGGTQFAAEKPAEYPDSPSSDLEEGFQEDETENMESIAINPDPVALVKTDPVISTEIERPVYEGQQTNPSISRTEAYSQPVPEPPVGTGVALVSTGEALLAESAADYVRQILDRRGITVFDGMSIPGVADMLVGGGSIQNLIRPHARYLVFIRADFTGERELNYAGRYDTEFQARLNLETHDLIDGRPIGAGVHVSVGYTHLSVENKVAEILRPKFGPIAGELSE